MNGMKMLLNDKDVIVLGVKVLINVRKRLNLGKVD